MQRAAAAIAETGAAGMKDMGKMIAKPVRQARRRMDFGKASGIVKASRRLARKPPR